MKRAFLHGAAIVLAVSVAASASSKLLPITLTELVNYSDLIAIGTVANLEETTKEVRLLGTERIATFHVERVLLGNPVDEVKVVYFPDWADSPRLSVGTMTVTFLAECDGHFEPIQGAHGMVRFAAANRIISSDIDGERETQSLSRFIDRIKSRERLGTLRLGHTKQFRCWSIG
jgi:hypothetical protein